MDQFLTTKIKKFVGTEPKLKTLQRIIYEKFHNNRNHFKEAPVRMSELINAESTTEIEATQESATKEKRRNINLQLKIKANLNHTIDVIDSQEEGDCGETLQLNRTDSELYNEKTRVIKLKITIPKTHDDFELPRNHVPIMGGEALKLRRRKTANDAEIVQKLVEANYNDFLTEYLERSNQRATLRRERFNYEESTPENEFNPIWHDVNFDGDDEETETEDERQFWTQNEPETTDLDDTQIEYDQKHFLKEALGDELETIEYLSNCSSLSRSFSIDHSIGTSEISALISKHSLYSTISKKPQTPIQAPIYEEPHESEKQNFFSNATKVEMLIEEASKEYQIMLQTTKALNFCRELKEFNTEKIEAERILLIATCKREELLKEIYQIDFHETDCEVAQNYATITLSGLKFFTNCAENNFQQCFVCLFKRNSTISASKIATFNEERAIVFDETFQFDRLKPDFCIKFALYSMKFNKKLNTQKKSPLKRIFKYAKSGATKKYERLLINTSFKLYGERNLTIDNLPNAKMSKQIFEFANATNLKNHVELNVNYAVKLNEKYSGFLTIGTESNGAILWTRRWCVLLQGRLNYWNYPNEEYEMVPIDCFDLKNSLSAKIDSAERKLCPRPKTLLLELCQNNTDQIARFFLSVDTLNEMQTWKNKINAVLFCLKSWKRMKLFL